MLGAVNSNLLAARIDAMCCTSCTLHGLEERRTRVSPNGGSLFFKEIGIWGRAQELA
jgi:hypothetical protein